MRKETIVRLIILALCRIDLKEALCYGVDDFTTRRKGPFEFLPLWTLGGCRDLQY